MALYWLHSCFEQTCHIDYSVPGDPSRDAFRDATFRFMLPRDLRLHSLHKRKGWCGNCQMLLSQQYCLAEYRFLYIFIAHIHIHLCRNSLDVICFCRKYCGIFMPYTYTPVPAAPFGIGPPVYQFPIFLPGWNRTFRLISARKSDR
jgi:hypothetical protein